MPLTTAGRDLIAAMILGEATTDFTNGNSRIGVGDSATAFAQAQTDMQAAANKMRKAMDATFPSRATNVLTFRATFATTEANWAWQEWGVFNAAAAGVMLNRTAESLGTKANTQAWQFTVDLTVTAS
jgi:hypothetical protein